jgi:hypothetical protein
MEENRRVKREKTIKVQSPLGTLNNSKENIKKTNDNKFLKLELLPIDANGFEVSARAKILKHLRDGETFYFGRSKVRYNISIGLFIQIRKVYCNFKITKSNALFFGIFINT